ncbi:MAG TPA: YncE family protein [Solirubrobacteraceae bacterium]|nr:YncE family protein [Solirubrobacteraceae bacterium]
MPRLVALLALAVLCAAAPAHAAAADSPDTRDVLYVGNNWDGTADVVDPHTFQRLHRLNIVPDKEERLAEIRMNPAAQGYFLGIRELVGEGHDQFVDDMFSSHDGRQLYVSRPSFADVVGFDLRTEKIVWRVKVEGYRADHMAISPDGRHVLVSASTARKVHVIDVAKGEIVGAFESGDQPHENNYSADGSTIYHASIGSVYTPADDPALDSTKGDRWFQVVDARTNRVLKRIDMGQKLEEAGHPNMSAAVRPMALSPDERLVYFQVSFFHGFVEYDLVADRVLRLAELPVSEEAAGKRREEYLLDSAHHGLAMDPTGAKLCVAGTMSDYAAIVRRDTFEHTIAAHGVKPYWATNSGDGKLCFVSFSGDDAVSAISYETGREVARIPVGDHPQRMRMGKLQVGLLGTAAGGAGGRAPAGGAAAGKPRLRVTARPRRAHVRRPVRVRVRVTRRDTGRPVRGANVWLAGVRARTNARGRAVLYKRRGFEYVRRYRLLATRRGHRRATLTIRSVR